MFALTLGFLTGILVNLLADYLPARRHYHLARTSPFASRPADLAPPRLLPRHWLWSGALAALLNRPVFHPPRRLRRAATEIGLAAAFAAISAWFPASRNLPFYLFYAAAFWLIAVIDIEHRWILWETLWPVALVTLLETALVPRMALTETWQGALLSFGATAALWAFGLLYGRLRRKRGRTVFGLGDVLLATVGGLILGWQAAGPALIVMMLSGGVAALILTINRQTTKRRLRRDAAIPYAPHIVIGIASLLYMPALVIDLLRRVMGFV